MYSEFVLCVITILVVYVFYEKQNGKENGKGKIPPGPMQWPIVGNLIQVGNAHPKFAHLAIHSLSKKYGELMTLKFGAHNSIVLSSFQTIKDLLGRNEFSGRYDGFHFVRERSYQKVLGVLFMSGDQWRESRRYTLRGLHDLGFGKRSSMESIMTQEINELESLFLKISSAPGANGVMRMSADLLGPNIVNLVWSYMTGTRFHQNDPNIKKMIELNAAAVDTMTFSYWSIPFPGLRKWFPGRTGVAEDAKTYARLQDFMKDSIENLRVNWKARSSPDGSPAETQTFIEAYLQEIENNSGKSSEETIFTEEHLILLMKDLFMAGSETTSNSLSWAILYMVLYPDVQTRIQKEINLVVPPGEFISMDYLPKLPYTEAVMLEISRIANVVPMHYRKTMEEVIYKDFVIPKGACVFFSQYSVLMDENYWGDPTNFRPERFLDETERKVVNKERVIIFGYGKRQCLGESVARNSFFVFLTTLLRKFTFSNPPGTPLPGIEPQDCFALKPYDYNVVIRSNEII